MSMQRTGARASTKSPESPETEKVTFEGAFVVPSELGERLFAFLGDLPYKYKDKLDPLVGDLVKVNRGTIILDVPKAPRPATKKTVPK